MKLRLLIGWVLMLYASGLMAQSSVAMYAVHFNTDDYQLDESDKAILEPLVAALTSPYYAEVNLKGHTDFEAGENYNQELSKRRCEEVKNFLLSKGVSSTRITTSAFGELKPKMKGKDDKSKALNRRVEAELQVFKANQVEDFLLLIDGDKKQSFTVDPTKVIKVKAKDGLQLDIPANAFVDENNRPVTADAVTIQVEELYGPREAFTHQLSTMSEGKLLETGGMFSVVASSNGKPLRLKDGETMDVRMPSKNLVNGMQVFTAVTNPTTGINEWKVSPTAFELIPEKKVELPFIYFDTTALRAFKLQGLTTPTMPDISYGSVPWPVAPHCPKAPMRPEPITKKDMFTLKERIFYSSSYMKAKLKEVNDRRMGSYEKGMAAWLRHSMDYEKKLAQYKIDSAQFEFATRDAFMNWLDETEIALKDYIEKKDKQLFNEGIERFCKNSSQKKLKALNLKAVFLSGSRPTKSLAFHLYKVRTSLEKIELLRNKSMAEIIDLAGDKTNHIQLGAKYANRSMNYFYNQYHNAFAANYMEENKGFRKLFTTAEDKIYDKQEKAGLLNNKDVAQIYTASLDATGLYNCDRFSNVPPIQMAEIKIDAPHNTRVSFYIPELNAYVYAYHSNEGYHVKLPKNRTAKLYAFTLNEQGEPMLAVQKITPSGDTRISPTLSRVSVKELRQSLEGA